MPDLDALITTTIRRFCELSGISRSKVYELLDEGSLESVYVGGRRLVLIASYRAFIDHQRAKSQKLAGAPRGQK